MKGIISKAVVGIWGAGLMAVVGGCYTYHDLVDPCYPQRYSAAARRSVTEALGAQVNNGRVLDQTIWNYHFEPGSDRLNEGGYERLNALIQRRPAPDPVIYLQTASNTVYDPADPQKYIQERTDLDRRREAAIKNYLNARTAGSGLEFQVVCHDPPENIGMPGISAGRAYAGMVYSYRGTLLMGAAGGTAAGGPGAGAPGGASMPATGGAATTGVR